MTALAANAASLNVQTNTETQTVLIAIQQLDHAADLPLPSYATAAAAGCDLMAAIADAVILKPGMRALIPTGLKIALPVGYEAQIRPRSGLALKQGVTVLNSPGTIDADYRGEIGVLLVNLGQDDVTIERGMRIAQMVIARHETAQFIAVAALDTTERGAGGFGSTGLHKI